MKLVFIAGPFRDECTWYVEQNIRHAELMSLEVARLGFMPVCPHTQSRYFFGLTDISEEFWLAGTQEMLRRCDAVMLVYGWELSIGTMAEIELAEQLNIPVFENICELRDWRKTND